MPVTRREDRPDVIRRGLEPWLATLPGEWRRARVTYSEGHMAMDVHAGVDLDGGETVAVAAPDRAVWHELTQLTGDLRDPERGFPLSITLERDRSDDPATPWRVRPDYDRRVYWGDHPGAPFAPPSAGPIRPTDDEWREAFGRGKYARQPAPAWVDGGVADDGDTGGDDDPRQLLAAPRDATTSIPQALESIVSTASAPWAAIAADLDARLAAAIDGVVDGEAARDLVGAGVDGPERQPESLRRLAIDPVGAVLGSLLDLPLGAVRGLLAELGDLNSARVALEASAGADAGRSAREFATSGDGSPLVDALRFTCTRIANALLEHRFGVRPGR